MWQDLFLKQRALRFSESRPAAASTHTPNTQSFSQWPTLLAKDKDVTRSFTHVSSETSPQCQVMDSLPLCSDAETDSQVIHPTSHSLFTSEPTLNTRSGIPQYTVPFFEGTDAHNAVFLNSATICLLGAWILLVTGKETWEGKVELALSMLCPVPWIQGD